MVKKRSEAVPASVRPTYVNIVALTDAFCHEYLNDEYALLSRQLAAALARKRPSPLLRGADEIWACGIVYALGSINFLFDKSEQPYLSADDLCAGFGVSKSSGANKSRQIRDMFRMSPFDPDWCLPSLADRNPYAWLLEVDGLIVDVRDMPRAVQEIAYRKGWIPYIPADRQKT